MVCETRDHTPRMKWFFKWLGLTSKDIVECRRP